MSSSAGIQNLLVNVFRPVYTYDSNTGVFTPTLQLANVAYSGTTISVSNAAIGDGNQNVYVGSNAGNSYLDLRGSDNNTALGFSAGGLISNVSNSVYLGYNAGNAASNASNVIAIGSNTGGNGINNIFIGSETGSTGSNNILIGHSIAGGTSNNLLRIGSNNIYGNLATRWVGIGTPTPTSGTNFDVSGNARVSGTLSAGTFDVSAISSSNLVVAGYLRNALVPTQFDISGGNISNSGTTMSSGVIAPYVRNALTPSRYDISQGTFAGAGIGDVSANTTYPLLVDYGGAGAGLFLLKGANNNRVGYSFMTRPNTATTSERFRIDPFSGWVGIGQPSPLTVLDVSGRARIVADGSSSLGGWGVNNGTDTLILQHTGNYGTAADLGKSASILFTGAISNGPQARIVSEMTSTGAYSANLIFQTNGQGASLAERMRIHSNGFVGIGTPTPSTTLDVSGRALIVADGSSSLTGYGVGIDTLVLQQRGSYMNTADLGKSTSILFSNAHGGFPQARIVSEMTGVSNGAYGANLIFQTNAQSGNLAERMRIHSNGNIGIGTRTPVSTLDVSGTISSTGGNVVSNANSTPYLGYVMSNDVGNYWQMAMYTQLGGGYGAAYGDALGFLYNNVARAYLDSSGNFGLGSLSMPSYTLDVSGTTRTTNLLAGGYIRNALTPNLFDISQGNIRALNNILAGNDITADFNVTGRKLITSYTGQFNEPAIRGPFPNLGLYFFDASTIVFSSANGSMLTVADHTGISTSLRTTTNGLISTYVRNALTPTTFDISGGNISNSGTLRTTNILASGYVRNALVPTQFDISGGNISNSGTVFSRGNHIVSNTSNFLGYLMSNDVGSNWQVGIYNQAGGGNGAQYGGALLFASNGAGRAYIDSNGNLGVGVFPSYKVDVNAAANTASVNMSTWPRNPVANTYVAKGISTYNSQLSPTFNSPLQNIDANLAEVTNSPTGTYFRIRKSGLWMVKIGPIVHTTTGTSMLDVSTNVAFNTGLPPHGNTTIDATVSAISSLTYYGYLPASSTLYYKSYQNNTTLTNNSNSGLFLLSFIAEMPAGSANFPYPSFPA